MNKQLVLALIMAVVTSFAYGQVPSPSTPMIMLPDGSTWTGNSSVEIATVTVDAFPVFKDLSGNPATAELDADDRAKVNLDAESIGLLQAISDSTKSCSHVYTRLVTLTPNVPMTITNGLPLDVAREFIHVSALNEDVNFWVNLGDDAAINASKPVHEWCQFPVRENITISLLSSETISLFIIEGGKQ